MKMPMIRPVSPFAAATLIPVPLLVLGALFGGIFVLAAVLYMTVLRMILDAVVFTAGTTAAPGVEFPAGEQLCELLAVLHFPLLLVGVAGLSGVTGLGIWEGLGVLLAFGLFFGQVSNSNAHELIHKTVKRQFRLGKWVLISLLYGHHVTAHLRIHHRHVATPDDPNSAILGQGFYDYLSQAWLGAFRAGYEIEKSAAEVSGKALPLWRHPYAEYVAGGVGIALLALLLFGPSGLIAYVLLAAFAQLQLLLSDYVQHYGLQRRMIDDERFEPVAPWHSWNAAQWFSGGLMLNGTRHSDHHTNPTRPYAELSIPNHTEGPRLPYSLPTMAAIALVPPLWRRTMDKRTAFWLKRIQDGAIQRNRPPAPMPASERPEPRFLQLIGDWWKRGSEKAEPQQQSEPPAQGQVPVSKPDGKAKAAPARRPAEQIEAEAEAARMMQRLAAAGLNAEDKATTSTASAASSPQHTLSSSLWSEAGAPPKPVAAPAEARPTGFEPDSAKTESDASRTGTPEGTQTRMNGTSADESPPQEEAPARFIRSSALYQPDRDEAAPAVNEPGPYKLSAEAEPAASAQVTTPEHAAASDADPIADPTADPDFENRDELGQDVDDAIAEFMAGSRKDGRRRRASLPALDPTPPLKEPTPTERRRSAFRSARIAAKALAALLSGGSGAERDRYDD